jgi:hypothetical protein
MPPKGSAAPFWSRVDTSGDCWEWQGARVSKGYGSLAIEGRAATAHRRSWELTYGPIPTGMHVLHRCDNPPCVRPDHLWLGTNTENVYDSMAKGRRDHLTGSRLPPSTCWRPVPNAYGNPNPPLLLEGVPATIVRRRCGGDPRPSGRWL